MHAFCACIYIQFFENSSPTVFTAIEIRGNAASSVCGNGYVLLYTRETRSHLLKINPFDLPFCTDSGHLVLFSYIVPPVPVHTFQVSISRYRDHRVIVTARSETRHDNRSSLKRNLWDNVRPDFSSRGWDRLLFLFTWIISKQLRTSAITDKKI